MVDERQVEGVRLAEAKFDEEVGGSTLFPLTRQGTGTVRRGGSRLGAIKTLRRLNRSRERELVWRSSHRDLVSGG